MVDLRRRPAGNSGTQRNIRTSQPASGNRASPWTAPLRFWHLSSLDAPTVAAVWSLAFGWVAHVTLPGWLPIEIALVTWVVYVGDRLLDARRAIAEAQLGVLRERHRFHWRHRRIFALLGAGAAAMALGIFAALVPAKSRAPDSVLGIAAFAYMARVHAQRGIARRLERAGAPFVTPFVSKELLVGVLFTAGCALPAALRVLPRSHSLAYGLAAPIVFFAALAWMNCRAIEAWEKHEGGRWIARAAAWIALAGCVLGWLSVASDPRGAALLLAGAVSALLMAGLDRLRSRIEPVTLRAVADLALLTPVVLLWR